MSFSRDVPEYDVVTHLIHYYLYCYYIVIVVYNIACIIHTIYNYLIFYMIFIIL